MPNDESRKIVIFWNQAFIIDKYQLNSHSYNNLKYSIITFVPKGYLTVLVCSKSLDTTVHGFKMLLQPLRNWHLQNFPS